MRAWLFRAPWWALAVVLGTAVGLVRLVGSRLLDEESWTGSAIDAGVGGLVFGLVVGPLIAWQNRRAREALGTDDPDVLRRAGRAARRGPAPEDPVAREQAHRMALALHDQALRMRRWVVPALVLGAASVVVMAVLAGDARVLVVLVPWGLLAGLFWLVPHWYQRRARLLLSGEG